MPGARKEPSGEPGEGAGPTPGPDSKPEEKQPQNASAHVRPETGQIIQIKVDDTEHGWRPAIVVSWLEFRPAEANVEWTATCQVFLAMGDHPFDFRSRMWADGHNTFIAIDPTNFGDAVGCWFQP